MFHCHLAAKIRHDSARCVLPPHSASLAPASPSVQHDLTGQSRSVAIGVFFLQS